MGLFLISKALSYRYGNDLFLPRESVLKIEDDLPADVDMQFILVIVNVATKKLAYVTAIISTVAEPFIEVVLSVLDLHTTHEINSEGSPITTMEEA